ncbi:MAG: homoserine dehydrogenase [Clostridia bacterium]|nr:homoserine dehydrogenase [Clostridia bacterium]MBR2176702.1 homoserine dehydrogenase [Clostridia bacterium]
MVQVAVMGHGVVGSGVVEVLLNHCDSIAKRAKEEINIKYILDIRDFPGLEYSDKFTKSFDDILNDEEVRVVAEVMGGVHPAYEFTKSCLLAGKSVVTSNKELVATKGAELLEIAKEKNVNYLFEASVGGGIPIIRPISQCLAANEVIEVAGILNGTTNFILTKMIKDHMSFEDALKMAQELGYAERNPAADVEGHDACRKICILASLSYGKHIYPELVHTQGITKITLEDVAYASSWGGVIKLIGQVKKLDDGTLDISVEPMFIENGSQLASVDDVFNGILVRGDATGDVVFYGKGAGKLPTASAVVADIIDCVKHLKARKYLYWADGDASLVKPYEKTEYPVYIRVETADKKAASEKILALFPNARFIVRSDAPENELAFVTESLTVDDQSKAAAELEKNGITVKSKIRISDL